MTANLDMSNNRANIAFMGARSDIWHRMGQQMLPGMSIDQWADQAGLGFEAVKVAAIAMLDGPRFDHIPAGERFRKLEDRSFIVRQDTGAPLGYVSGESADDGYQIVQPRSVLDWFQRYISVDDRFALDTAGSLDGGKRIWAAATFNGDMDVAGSAHRARLLMTTSFDGTASTINKGTMTRVVCQNTMSAALADKRCEIRTRHSTKFDAAKVGRELAAVAKGFTQYKAIGDALALNEMSGIETTQLFKAVLEIPFDTPRKDISTRKSNQFDDLVRCYQQTVDEGTDANTAWTALNAVTRYVDHDRSARGDDKAVARFDSAQFGSGAALKSKVWDLLIPRVKDRVLIDA